MHAGQAEDTTLLAISREAQLYEAIAAAGKLGIDATIPLGTWTEHSRKRAPGLGHLRLDDFR